MAHKKKEGNLRIASPKGKWIAGKSKDAVVFIGPSVDGTDEEYVKVLSGRVEHKKPSFA